ncbi:class I SAM-dependent methyltransferase [Candidatus Kaiserbacteria bacterium]|nr:class I SAM-dependent methyltransferase [Candidatus Kaiserbacteria bacterium]
MSLACRSCRSSKLLPILSLGKTPLANALLTRAQLDEPETTYPLDLVFCPRCTLVQITKTIPPETLFRNYFYFSSVSDTILKSACELAERMIEKRDLGPKSFVVEIASNDGYLLKNYAAREIPVLGIEPARNIAEVAQKRGIPTIAEFFDERLARKLVIEDRTADVIHAHNVIAHVADLHGVVAGIATLLKPDGIAIVENHYVKDLIDHTEFDSIYHEHLCYYSVTSFKNLFAVHGLRLVDVERIPLHGGSLRVFFQQEDGPQTLQKEGAKRVETLLEEEVSWGVANVGFYAEFGKKVELLKTELLSLLKKLKSQGKHIAVYGASAKSTTLLNYFGIGKETIDYVVDRSPAKQGHFTPGTHLEILPPEKLMEDRPDYTLLLAWNFANEVLAQQDAYRKAGGRFIIPIPELKVV